MLARSLTGTWPQTLGCSRQERTSNTATPSTSEPGRRAVVNRTSSARWRHPGPLASRGRQRVSGFGSGRRRRMRAEPRFHESSAGFGHGQLERRDFGISGEVVRRRGEPFDYTRIVDQYDLCMCIRSRDAQGRFGLERRQAQAGAASLPMQHRTHEALRQWQAMCEFVERADRNARRYEAREVILASQFDAEQTPDLGRKAAIVARE
jgi:hypothetical protein